MTTKPYRLVLTMADLRRALRYVPPRSAPPARVARPYVFVSATRDSQTRPIYLSNLRKVFGSIESTRHTSTAASSDLQLLPLAATLEYRDPWDLPESGDFRQTALRFIEGAEYVLSVISNFTPGVAYELGFALASEKPLGLLWFTQSTAGVRPFATELVPTLIQKLQIKQLRDADMPEVFASLHVQLLQLQGRKRCPKLDSDGECAYVSLIARARDSTRAKVVLAFQRRHADQKDRLEKLVAASGMQPVDLDTAAMGSLPGNETTLCKVCFTLRCASRVVVDITRVPKSEGGEEPTAEDRVMMLVAGMASGLKVDTLHLYDGRTPLPPMVDGVVGTWGDAYVSDLTSRWNNYLAAQPALHQ